MKKSIMMKRKRGRDEKEEVGRRREPNGKDNEHVKLCLSPGSIQGLVYQSNRCGYRIQYITNKT